MGPGKKDDDYVEYIDHLWDEAHQHGDVSDEEYENHYTPGEDEEEVD
jgi:hypothetical protein